MKTGQDRWEARFSYSGSVVEATPFVLPYTTKIICPVWAECKQRLYPSADTSYCQVLCADRPELCDPTSQMALRSFRANGGRYLATCASVHVGKSCVDRRMGSRWFCA